MIQAKELRIGNWAYSPIMEDNIKVDCITGSINVEPIPLTEEWLIKFGFELDGEQINGKYYKKQLNYSSGFTDYLSIGDKGDDKSPIYLFDLTSDYGKFFVLPYHYKHVHQLQNLIFALTGEELETK